MVVDKDADVDKLAELNMLRQQMLELEASEVRRVQVEEALRQSDLRFRLLVDYAPYGIALINASGLVELYNPAFTEIFGYLIEDIPDTATWFKKAYPDKKYRARALREWQLAFAKAVKRQRKSDKVFTIRCKDGSDKVIQFKLVNISKERVLVVFEDITEQRKAEAALQASETRYRNIFENAIEGIYQTTPNGQYLSVNPSFVRMFGYASIKQMMDEVTDIGQQLYVNPLDRERLKALLANQGRVEGFEAEVYRRDGQKFWISINAHVVRDNDGSILYFEGTNEDITSRKQQEERLCQANLELAQAYDATLEGWSNALELRERETAGHSQRVVDLTLSLGKNLGLDALELVHLRRGALLHDIGKMALPDSLLLKPGPLTPDEWVIMRQHPIYAYELLRNITYLQPALDIPLYHHEWWNGDGYPHGLRGEQIPLAARIFAVVDVWDALVSNRPYRPAWKRRAALDYIRQQTGIHFDPWVAVEFIQVIESFSPDLGQQLFSPL